MKSKNILEICLSPDLGGLELYMSRCSHELSKSFNIFCAISEKSRLDSYLEDLNLLKLKRKSSFSLMASYKLAKYIDTHNIDIIHLHWTKDIPIVVFAKIFSKRKPKIVQTRHMTMTRFKNDFYHKFLYKNIDVVICVTKALEEQLNKFIPNEIRPKIKTIYLGANDTKRFSTQEIEAYKNELTIQNDFMVGLVGRINEFKGQYLLIEAMRELVSKGLNIKAFIVGHAMNEKYLEQLKQKVSDYKLENSLKFLGFINSPSKFMQACDVILMTSKNETFGLVTIEAMKNNTTVIGANHGGVLEIIDDNKTGLLFQSGDYKDLALKIERIYNDTHLKQSLSENARKKVDEEFDNNKQYKKLIEFFENL